MLTSTVSQFIKDSDANKEAMRIAEAQMRERLGQDPRLCDMLIPKWPLGCRRITPGEGYLESFLRPNCDLTQSPIEKIEENAIRTKDGVYEIDVCKSKPRRDISIEYPLTKYA